MTPRAVLPLVAFAFVFSILGLAPGAANDIPLPCDNIVGQNAGNVCGIWVVWSTLPAPRYGHAVAHDSGHSRAYVHGGYDASGTVQDTLWSYSYGANSWTVLPAGPARADAVLIYDATGDDLYLFGGSTGSGQAGDVWRYDAPTAGWSVLATGAGPTPRHGHVGGWNAADRELTIFGGATATGNSGELWRLDVDTGVWDLGANAPAARTDAAAVWDNTRNGLLVHGGTQSGAPLSDAWLYEPLVDRWTSLGPSGAGRAGHAAAYDAPFTNMFTFGGAGAAGADGQTWAFSPHSGIWMGQGPTPGAVVDAAATWNTQQARAFLFGGLSAGTVSDEVWWFSPATATWAI